MLGLFIRLLQVLGSRAICRKSLSPLNNKTTLATSICTNSPSLNSVPDLRALSVFCVCRWYQILINALSLPSYVAIDKIHRSLWEIPGLWLLSLSLSGARQRNQGSLSLPIGIRAGILATSFILKMGGFLNYHPKFPLWLTGGHPFQPFSGIVGLAFSLVLALVFYPRQLFIEQKIQEPLRE